MKLKDLGAIVTGNTPSKSNKEFYNSKDINFFKPSDFKEDIVNELKESEEYISEQARKRARVLPRGSVLVTCIGTIGKVGILDNDSICNQQINAIIPNELVESEYLAYLLLSKRNYLKKKANAPVVPIINKTDFSNIEIEIHDIKTQKIIADKLKRIRNLIVIKQEEIKKIDEFVKLLFIKMFDNINDYEKISFYIDSLDAGKSLAGEDECINKVLKTGSVSYDYFDQKEVKNLPNNYTPLANHEVKKGDVIISRMNTADLVGACGYVWEDVKNIYYPDRLWRANLKNNCNAIYIWQSIIQNSFKLKIKEICSGTSGSMKNISKANFLNLKIKKVTLEEQNVFAKIVSNIHKQKTECEESLKKLEEMQSALMQEYFG